MQFRRHVIIFSLLVALIAALLIQNSPLVRSQAPTAQRIESDDASVTRAGSWTSQPASQASGGSYLYSSGADDDVLTLEFSGPSIEVIFVAGPTLGTLAIEVDDIVLRTVISTADQTAYQQSSRLDYLSDEPHTLKVYAQAGGVVAIDAFVAATISHDVTPVASTSAGGNVVRDGLGPGTWSATYIRDFPNVACTIPILTDTPVPAGATHMGTYPVASGEINFDWGDNTGPAQVSPNTDRFGIIFRRTVTFADYTEVKISYTADDGLRILDNGFPFMDHRWGCNVAIPETIVYTFSPGIHDLEIQYVEVTGAATVQVQFTPLTLTAVPEGENQIRLTWNDAWPDETAYYVYRSEVFAPPETIITSVSGNTTTYLDTGLNCSTVYLYRVRAYRASDSRLLDYSSTAYTTPRCAGGAPTYLRVTANPGAQIDVQWDDNSTDESEFRVERSPDGVANWTEIAAPPANATRFTESGLSCGTAYYYRVRAYRASDTYFTAYSNSASISACHLYTPTALSLYPPSNTQWQLRWNDVSEDESEFRIERSPQEVTGWTEVATVSADVTTYIDGSLTCGTPYFYRIRAYRSSDGAFSEYTQPRYAQPYPCPPPAPSNLVVTPLDDQHIHLSWTDNSSYEQGFRIERSLDGIEWLDIAGLPPNTHSTTNISLRCNTTYLYRVRAAYSAAGIEYSDYSNVTSATTAACPASCTHNATISRASVTSNGTAGNGFSGNADVSNDGRWVAFQSDASNLVAGDSNGQTDVFVNDTLTCQVWRVSVASDGTQGVGISTMSDLSPNGRYVGFVSSASNLSTPDANNAPDAFVHDLWTGQTILLAIRPQFSTQAISSSNPVISDTGLAVFAAEGQGWIGATSPGTYLLARQLPEAWYLIGVSWDSGYVMQPVIGSISISADGRYVGYGSTAAILPTDTNTQTDVYLRDMFARNSVTLISVSSGGAQGDGSSLNPTVSSNSRYVAFETDATNLTSGDTNHHRDVLLRDIQSNTTVRVSISDGVEGNADAIHPSPTDHGAVYFESSASNWMNGITHTQIFRYHPSFTGLAVVSRSGTGVIGNGASIQPHTTGNGRYLAFESSADNLIPDDTVGGYPDAFVIDLLELPAASNLTATAVWNGQIQLIWIDNAEDETEYRLERSLNGTSGWVEIGVLPANTTSHTDVNLSCSTIYHYRIRAYRASDTVYSGYSNVAHTSTSPCRPDALALVNPATRSANLFRTLTNPPAGGDYTQFATGFPYGTGGQYVTGDWNGDGLDTIGVYREGAFFFTNDFGTGGTWGGIWFGLGGQPVVGRFDATINHDCLGVTDSGTWTNGDTFFALYFTCNLTSGPTPPLTFQWLSILLPTSQGFTGTFQFVAGDFNGDGVDSVAVRRGAFIAWTNVAPTTLHSQFNLAQYIGAPGNGDEGKVVAGDWDMNNVDSFGLVYQNGTFYRRNDVEWNTGVYLLQTFTPIVGTPFDVASWQPN